MPALTLSSKTIAGLVAALVAVSATLALGGTAEAGCGGSHGYSRAYSPTPSHAAQLRARKAAEARAVAAAKRKKALEVARARERAEARAVAAAKAKTATPVVASAEPAATETKASQTASAEQPAIAPVEVAAAPATCLRFVPATGTTAEVPCSAE